MTEEPRRFLILATSRGCPNCGSKPGPKSYGTDYDCPVCGRKFCSKCYKVDIKGRGNYVFCPHCETKLFFSEKILAAINSR